MKKELKDMVDVDKLIYLLRIQGSVKDLKDMIKDKRKLPKLGGIRNMDKLTKVIDYFQRL